jgi:hypothetical protein
MAGRFSGRSPATVCLHRSADEAGHTLHSHSQHCRPGQQTQSFILGSQCVPASGGVQQGAKYHAGIPSINPSSLTHQMLVCRWVALEDPVDGSQPWGALWPGEVLPVYMHQLLCHLLLLAGRSMQAQT